MVATRRSLGGQPQSSTSPPTPPLSSLSRAQQAALRKLDIAGTDALKGDPKAAQAARDQVQTYHYRGAVYAADANTPSAWLENQPKRYLKRSWGVSAGAANGADDSIAVGEEKEETDARPTKRRSMPSSNSSSSSSNHKPETSSSSSARGKPRAGREARQSLPAKRKAAALDNDNNTTNMQYDYTSSGGYDDRVILPRLPKWLPENANDRKERLDHRANPIPTKKSPVPNKKTMQSEIKRLKQEANRKKYQIEPLRHEDTIDEKALVRARVVKLVKQQTLLKYKLLEWEQAKQLLEAKKREAGLKSHAQNTTEQHNEINFQPTIDLAGSSTDEGGSQKGDDQMVDEQWKREQEQNRNDSQPQPNDNNKTNDEPEIPKTSPESEQQPTNNRPSTPAPSTSTLLTGPNALPHPTTRGYTPSQPPNATPSTTSTTRTTTATSFASLPPNADLPTTAADGNRVRWSIQRSMSVGEDGEERAEYAIDLARLEGESKSARRRRIERERDVVDGWARLTGGRIVERNASSGGSAGRR